MSVFYLNFPEFYYLVLPNTSNLLMRKFTEDEILFNLQKLKDWKLKNGKLYKKIVFENFSQALAKMVEIGIYAEKINHHPEWFNVYNRLEIELTTHDANGITEKDFLLAEYIDKVTT